MLRTMLLLPTFGEPTRTTVSSSGSTMGTLLSSWPMLSRRSRTQPSRSHSSSMLAIATSTSSSVNLRETASFAALVPALQTSMVSFLSSCSPFKVSGRDPYPASSRDFTVRSATTFSKGDRFLRIFSYPSRISPVGFVSSFDRIASCSAAYFRALCRWFFTVVSSLCDNARFTARFTSSSAGNTRGSFLSPPSPSSFFCLASWATVGPS
mmetsp:Transcript_31057/g.99650  ORF Transcript_31057/g.99650 Transcript_31057/m.99650 type:complete len:209 (-) Transcript_31057:319-945(-)